VARLIGQAQQNQEHWLCKRRDMSHNDMLWNASCLVKAVRTELLS